MQLLLRQYKVLCALPGKLLKTNSTAVLQEITKILEAAAVDGMISDMAQWMGILIRCGHARYHTSHHGSQGCTELYPSLNMCRLPNSR